MRFRDAGGIGDSALPGAVGMFCMGASYTGKGDSAYIARAIEGSSEAEFAKYFAYFEATNPKDPLVYPVLSNSVMAAYSAIASDYRHT